MSGDKTIAMLHRVVRWEDAASSRQDAIEYEADPRHRDVLLEQLCLQSPKGVTHSFEKFVLNLGTESELNGVEAETFRCVVMRLEFLVLDRPGIQYAAKQAPRGMARPIVRHQRILRRCARYLIKVFASVWRWERQRWSTRIVVRGDTDWAGCPLTRRCTSGVTEHFGKHTWYTNSTTQVPVSLSSGEAEMYGLTKSCSCALSFKFLPADLCLGDAWKCALTAVRRLGQHNTAEQGISTTRRLAACGSSTSSRPAESTS